MGVLGAMLIVMGVIAIWNYIRLSRTIRRLQNERAEHAYMETMKGTLRRMNCSVEMQDMSESRNREGTSTTQQTDVDDAVYKATTSTSSHQ